MRPNGVEKQVRPSRHFNWDLSKAISDNRTSFSLWNYSYEIMFDDTWTKMFVWHSNASTGRIYMYPLTTARDITTADSNTRVTYGEWSVRTYPNPCFADNWNKLFVWYSGGTTYARYDLGTAYDLSNVVFTSPDATFTMPADLWIMSVSANGKTYLYRAWGVTSLTYAVSSTAWQPLNSETALLSSSNVMSWTFCNEWKMLMVMDGTTIKKYELWTAYDLTTLNTTPIQSQSTGLSWHPRWIYVDTPWDNIYININNVLYRYHLV